MASTKSGAGKRDAEHVAGKGSAKKKKLNNELQNALQMKIGVKIRKKKKTKRAVEIGSSDDTSSSDWESQDLCDNSSENKFMEENNSDEELLDEEIPQNNAKKNTDVLVTHQIQSRGPKTMLIGNLSSDIQRSDIEKLFKGSGEVLDIRFSKASDGTFKGVAHVEFCSAEAAEKAFELNGKDLMGQAVVIDWARERGPSTRSRFADVDVPAENPNNSLDLSGSDLGGYSLTGGDSSLSFPKAMKIKFIPPRPPAIRPCNSTRLFSTSSTLDSLGDPKEVPILQKFRQAAFDLAVSDPTRTLTEEIKSCIETNLITLCPALTAAPSHPTYASMILGAITELGEESGSNENDISEFIRREYDRLPWAHSSFLKHHLKKLCETQEISINSDGYYYIPFPVLDTACDLRKKRRKTQKRKHCSNVFKGGRSGHGEDVQGKVEDIIEDGGNDVVTNGKSENATSYGSSCFEFRDENLQYGKNGGQGSQKTKSTEEKEEQKVVVLNLQPESLEPKSGAEKDEQKLTLKLQCGEKSRGRGRPRKEDGPKTKPMEEGQGLVAVDLHPESPDPKSGAENDEQKVSTPILHFGEKSRGEDGPKTKPTKKKKVQGSVAVDLHSESPDPKSGAGNDEQKVLTPILHFGEKSRGRGRPRKQEGPETNPAGDPEPKNGGEIVEQKLSSPNLQCSAKSRGRGRPRKQEDPKRNLAGDPEPKNGGEIVEQKLSSPSLQYSAKSPGRRRLRKQLGND